MTTSKQPRIELAPGLRATVRALQALMLALVGLQVVVLTPPVGGLQTHWNSPRDLWLATAVLVLSVVVTATRAVLVRPERAAWACISAAAACWTAGFVYFVIVVRAQSPMPSPTLADVGWLAFYPFAWCGIALLLRKHSRKIHANLWLDGIVGGLAAAAAAAVVLPSIVTATGGPFATVATNLCYPVADLVLLAAVVGAFGLFGWKPPPVWLLLGAGMVAFVVSDSVYLLQSAAGSYQPGTTLDAGWRIGLVLPALAAWRPESAQAQERPAGRMALVIPSLCSLFGLGLLTYGALFRLPEVTVVLAAGCVLAGLARTALTLRDVRALGTARREALTDDLTGLANRRHFYSRLARALDVPIADCRLAVIVIDLDRFKQINDSLGHRVGDSLINLVGQRLTGVLPSGDLLARLGGDEFAVIVAGADGDAAQSAAKRLRDALQAPFVLDELTLHLDASFGVALVPDHGDDVDQLLQRADLAMYQAKATGSGLETYAHDRDGNIDDRLVATEELRKALYDDQLVLHYQPKLTVATGKIAGVEALVRWQHPERGLVYPDQFLPLAEAAGLMPALTTVVIDQALRQCAAWRADGIELSVAVNLSASDLLDAELPALVHALLSNLDLPPSALHLEITETVLVSDGERSLQVLERLNRSGLRVAIDDYGTGYSSLAYLAKLPVHDLKLDQSFIETMDGHGVEARRATSIVTSTIALARGLGLGFIAEGVETATSLAELTELGCETVQGYYLSRPLPAAALMAWLLAREDAEPDTGSPIIWTLARKPPEAHPV
jgi:diguanylate cyclase (GGDEF)-like protein